MKTSVFIFLFLLVSSLSSVMDSGAKSGVPAAAAVRQTAECFLAGFKYGDCVATETVRTAVPCPVRSLRKPVEGPQRVSGGDRDVCSGRHFPLAQGCCTKYVVSSLLRGGRPPCLSIAPTTSGSAFWSFSRQILSLSSV